jgi:glyoxylate reductase
MHEEASYHVVASAPLVGDVRGMLPASWKYDEPAEKLDREQLVASAASADGLIPLLTDRIDEELLDACPRLKVVANFAVGYDNVDVAACTRRNIVATNTPDVLTDATADFAFALMLAAGRRLVEGDRWVRSGTWPGWAPGQHLGVEVAHRTLGIVGLGRIGQAVARRARGFDMDILYAGHRDVAEASELGATRVATDELLARADFVTLHCPLTDETRDLIDGAALEVMKPTAILVNTARGGCVNEAALAEALERGEIAGAGLDVFREEPRVHPALVASDRVVLAPHAGSATTTARTRMAEICANAVRTVLLGGRPETVINPEVYE